MMTLPFGTALLAAVETWGTNPADLRLVTAWFWVRLTTEGTVTVAAAVLPPNIALPARPTRTNAAMTASASRT